MPRALPMPRPNAGAAPGVSEGASAPCSVSEGSEVVSADSSVELVASEDSVASVFVAVWVAADVTAEVFVSTAACDEEVSLMPQAPSRSKVNGRPKRSQLCDVPSRASA